MRARSETRRWDTGGERNAKISLYAEAQWRRVFLIFSVFSGSRSLPFATAAVPTQQPEVRIRAARVLDGTGQVLANATVVVRGATIAAIEASSAEPADIDLGKRRCYQD